MENEFKLRKINDEIDACDDRAVLKEQLKAMTHLYMRYHHLLNHVLQAHLARDSSNLLEEKV
jgi:hypothetical protein